MTSCETCYVSLHEQYSCTRPQVVMATAQVLFQRFWFVTSLKHFGIRVSARRQFDPR